MKHRTADLKGDLLHAAVALAEGHRLVGQEVHRQDGSLVENTDYSNDWSLGGRILERWRLDRLTFEREDDGTWSCLALGRTAEVWYAVGTTKLIAAMRAYVASKLGEKVELP